MTEAKMAAIQAMHAPVFSGARCACCMQRWPCDTEVALARIEELEKGLRAILSQHREIAEGARRSHCEVCYPQDGVYPCVTVLEARAALEEGE